MCNFREQEGSVLVFCKNGLLYKKNVIFGCIGTSSPKLQGKCPHCGGGSGTAPVIPAFLSKLLNKPLTPSGCTYASHY